MGEKDFLRDKIDLNEKVYFGILAVIFFIAFYHTLKSFNPGYIVSWDGPAHLVRAEHFYKSLNLEELGIWGWYHGWYLGSALFIFYTPGFFIVVSLLKIITFGLASIDLIIRIVLSFTYAIFPIILYWLSNSLGFSKKISIVASILSLGFSGIWGIGLTGLYSIGLYTAVFSLLPFMLFLGNLHKIFFNKENNIIVTGLLLGFVIITNMITAIFSFIVIFSYLFLLFIMKRKYSFIKIFKLLLIGIFSSLFWIFPFLSSINLFGPETGFYPFGLVELIRKLFLGEIIFHPIISIFLILGVVYSLWVIYKKQVKSFPYLIIIFLLLLTILISSDILTKLTNSWQNSILVLRIISRVFRSLLRTRALIFLWVVVPILAGIGVNFILNILEKYMDAKIMKKIVLIMVILLIIFSYVQISNIAEKDVKTTSFEEYKENYMEFNLSFQWLRANAKKNSVVLTDINWDMFSSPGTISIDSLINLETGLRTVNGNQIEASQLDSWYINHLEFKDDEREKKELHKFNVDYIFSYRKPEYNVSYLEKVYRSKDIIIYKTVNLSGPYSLIWYEIAPNRYYFKIYVYESGRIEIPVQYNNHWIAVVNNQSINITRGNSGLVELNLKKGVNDIQLTFRRTPIESIVFLISVFTVIFCCINLLYNNIKIC